MKNSNPMYFLSLDVENIRCFGERQTLDLSDGEGNPAFWTLILGDNGVGKTTLLQSLTWMRTVEEPKEGVDYYPEPIKSDTKKKQKAFNGEGVLLKPIMDDLDENTEIERLVRNGDNIVSKIKGTYLIRSVHNSTLVEVGMNIRRSGGKLEEVNPVPDYVKTFQEPKLLAYGASRHMAIRNIDKMELRDPVRNLLSESADLYDAEQVLLDLDYKAHKNTEGKVKLLLECVKELLVDLLPDIENSSSIQIFGPRGFGDDEEASGVKISMPYGSVSLPALSLGYKTMFAWAVDLALRLLWSNPESKRPLEESAIVIIDEIDLHLHPKWQRTLRTYLCKHFPNVQFICTAHSPFLVQVSEESNVAVLMKEGNHVVIENDPLIVSGWRIDQIATNLMGLSSARSFDVEALINERRSILGKKRKQKKDKDRLAELDKIISNLPTEENKFNQAAIDLINKAAKIIEKKKYI